MRNEFGLLDYDSLVLFQKLVLRHTILALTKREKENKQERFRLLKSGSRQREYTQCIMKGRSFHQQQMNECTGIAAEYIGLQRDQFLASVQLAQGDKSTLEQLQNNERLVRLEISSNQEPLSLEKAKQILKGRIELEYESQERMASLPKPENDAEANQYSILLLVEQTLISDKLEMKHQVNIVDLLKAEQLYDLANDPEIVELHKKQAAKKLEKGKKVIEEMP